jgi:sulfur-oxidizing protein SoxY
VRGKTARPQAQYGALRGVGRQPPTPMTDTLLLQRRALLSHAARVAGLLSACGLWPAAAQAAVPAQAFDAKSLPELARLLGGSTPAESREVSITGPDVAENGASVTVNFGTTLPGARRLLLLVEKNPSLLAAAFELSDAVEASFVTRLKLGQSSNVYAVAMGADGRVLFAQREIRVTLGGCGA